MTFERARNLLLLGSRSLLAAMVLAPLAARAEIAVRITDLRPGAFSGVPGLDAAVFADKLYFAGTADGGSLDLWVYDGLSPATKVLGSDEIQPTYLTVWQGALHFLGGPRGDRELWRYDGVNPPLEVLDLLDPGSGSPAFLTPFGPELCFRATSPDVGAELVCWDGATAPDVYDLRAAAAGSSPENLTVLGDRLYFGALVDDTGREPWSHENFLAPELVGDLRSGTGSSSPDSFVLHGAELHLRAADSSGQGRVWVDDGVNPPAMVSTTFDVEGGLASWNGRLLVGGYEEDGPLGRRADRPVCPACRGLHLDALAGRTPAGRERLSRPPQRPLLPGNALDHRERSLPLLRWRQCRARDRPVRRPLVRRQPPGALPGPALLRRRRRSSSAASSGRSTR